ncbi:RTA1 domain protein [Drechmeria coniospora]|uniref:RTA1 domain protein n=1 Tax=Drechmeria coniospora TaxID=98403 RepID=A0A151GPU4_DRECN|nr:RTA1 domain protein [Drechmeria coniospora]KYK59113.1 RTA1 domain protein [Drechmeria coniospora]ODA77865.1 hypothetical protein RJ55_06467 [Drechmeria coniospora]
MSGNSTGHLIDRCHEVSALCPVEATVLGYYPNLGSSIFFTVAFGLCLVAAVPLAVWKRTWTYGAAVTLGLILETAGYVGRILLHANPWDEGAFELQICAIIIGPTFICAAIYLTLKHVALALGPNLSRVPPVWYPRLFLPADLGCLVVQAIGGGVASAAGHAKPALQRSGNRLIVAGVALQVVVLLLFGLLALDYWLRVRRAMRLPPGSAGVRPEQRAVWMDARFRAFVFAVTGAYLAVFIRVAEMAGGWGNHIMQDQISFLILDSTLVLVAVSLLTIFHPGIFFPQMRNGGKGSKNGNIASSDGSGVADGEGTGANDAADSSGDAKVEKGEEDRSRAMP